MPKVLLSNHAIDERNVGSVSNACDEHFPFEGVGKCRIKVSLSVSANKQTWYKHSGAKQCCQYCDADSSNWIWSFSATFDALHESLIINTNV